MAEEEYMIIFIYNIEIKKTEGYWVCMLLLWLNLIQNIVISHGCAPRPQKGQPTRLSLTSVNCEPGQWRNKKCEGNKVAEQACRAANMGRQCIVSFFGMILRFLLNKSHRTIIKTLRGNFVHLTFRTSRKWTQRF